MRDRARERERAGEGVEGDALIYYLKLIIIID